MFPMMRMMIVTIRVLMTTRMLNDDNDDIDNVDDKKMAMLVTTMPRLTLNR